LVAHGDRVIVDTFVSGDGNQGRRTARTTTSETFLRQGWGDWRAEAAAVALHTEVERRIGTRAGWSQSGFLALTKPQNKINQD